MHACNRLGFRKRVGMCGAYGWEEAGLVHMDRAHMQREGHWRFGRPPRRLVDVRLSEP